MDPNSAGGCSRDVNSWRLRVRTEVHERVLIRENLCSSVASSRCRIINHRAHGVHRVRGTSAELLRLLCASVREISSDDPAGVLVHRRHIRDNAGSPQWVLSTGHASECGSLEAEASAGMPYDPDYHESTLTREEVEQLQGPVLLEFGASWCGICSGFAPRFESLLDRYPAVQHIKIEDGRGKPLGRSFRVKLWPTLVFLRNGRVLKQISRPDDEEVRAGLDAITTSE